MQKSIHNLLNGNNSKKLHQIFYGFVINKRWIVFSIFHKSLFFESHCFFYLNFKSERFCCFVTSLILMSGAKPKQDSKPKQDCGQKPCGHKPVEKKPLDKKPVEKKECDKKPCDKKK